MTSAEHTAPRLCRVAVILAVLAVTVASGKGAAIAASPPVTLPLPRALALPAAAFPRGSAVHSGPATNEVAQRSTGLHTVPYAQLGRVEGYLQTARWSVTISRGRTYALTLQYNSSIFASSDGADAAYTDARASLWELGRPIGPAGVAAPAFAIRDRSGNTSVVLVSREGSLEEEMVLHYGRFITGGRVVTALRQLAHAWAAATTVTNRIAPSLPVQTTPPLPQPDVFVAPAGVGPVVKSPSLLVLDPSLSSGDSLAIDGGAFRSSAPPPLGASARPAAALIPGGSLSRYVALGSAGTGRQIYDSAALFTSVVSATSAFAALTRASGALKLTPLDLAPSLGALHRLSSADAVAAWGLPGETVLAARQGNVVMVLAGSGALPSPLPGLADGLLASVPSWLHAAGTQIVDATGAPVHLAGLNWYGAEQQDFVVGGLDYQPYQSILWSIKQSGYNSIRIPFSNQLVEQNPVVTAHVGANPELAGLHALDILDRIIGYAGALGLSVILDDHRSDAGWSSEENGLWYTDAYPDTAFDRDWAAMAARYAGNNVVIGADLRNEPHGPARWGNGDPATDWQAAAERAGNAVLAANPHLLVMVEGVQFYGTAPGYWWGGNLMGVATAPVLLHFTDGSAAQSQLVYSAHDYGVDNCGTGCPWFNTATSYASLAATWEGYWGYITADSSKPYAAPVWIGEFGTCNYGQTCVSDTVAGSQGQWFQSLVQYIGSKHLSWAYWSANGTQSTGGTRTYGTLDWYGYFQQDWRAPVPWLTSALRAIETDGGGGTPSSTP